MADDGEPKPDPQARADYIAADEVAWNYAPTGINMITRQRFDATANKYVQIEPDRIGSRDHRR